MQKGFATLEIVCVIFIIVMLASVALPNAVRMIDRAALDYETKRLYSDLRFLQDLNRSAKVSLMGTGDANFPAGDFAYMNFTLEPPSYQIVRGSNIHTPAVREPHVFSYGVKISFKKSLSRNTISSDEFGQMSITSNAVILTSRLGKKNYIIFDAVGRIRGSLKDSDDD